MESSTIQLEYVAENGALKELQPEIPATRPFEVFSPEKIDEMVEQWQKTVEEDTKNLNIWLARKEAAIQLNIGVETDEEIVEEQKEE